MRTIIIFMILLLAPIIYGQDSTPTQAPSKTPTIAPTTDTSNTNTDSNRVVSSIQAFSQEDLNLLVGNVQRPNGIIWYNNELYTVCNGDWTLYRINSETGDTITFVFGVKNGNTLLAETTTDGFDLWIPDADSDTLWKVDHNRSAPLSINNNLNTPWGIVRVEDRFLITSSKSNSILEVSETGSENVVLTDLRSPTGITRQDNIIYFANGGSARRGIEWFEINEDGTYSEPQSLISGLQNTTNLVIAEDGYLYFGYALGTRGVVGRVNPELCHEDGCTNEDIEIVVFSDIPAPIAGLTISDDMRLFFHSRYRPEIYWVQVPVDNTNNTN